jgi:hypothetical protein
VPLGGFTIEVFQDNGDGLFTAADNLFGSAVSDVITGAYTVSGLTDGQYFVRQVPAAGYTQTVGLPYYELLVDDAQVFVGQQLVIDDFVAPAPSSMFQASAIV